MIFHEMYGCYYHAVSKAIRAAQEGTLDEKKLKAICDETAFSESFLAIIPALKEQRWQLLCENWKTPLQHVPTRPLTELERRWLKAITLDPRFTLFGVEVKGLEGVLPLFTPEDYVIFDQYGDGAPYTDAGYIDRFRIILRAIREKKQLAIEYCSRKGMPKSIVCRPRKLEYSEKDDKFRLILSKNGAGSVNLQRIQGCRLIEEDVQNTVRRHKAKQRTMTFLLQDQRNALERAMLHFAHFEKETERLAEDSYRVRLRYAEADETELLIRVLSFGPLIRVTEPDSFVALIRDRLQKQQSCGLF